MMAGLIWLCAGSIGLAALAAGLGFRRTQIAKAGLGWLLAVVVLYGGMRIWANISHARRLEGHPLPGTWMCVSLHCPPELTFDDLTWQMDAQLVILQKPSPDRDGVITSGTKTCNLTLLDDAHFSVNCNGNTIDVRYQITGDRLKLDFYNNGFEYDRLTP